MPIFSDSSKKKLRTLHPDLQKVLVEAILYTDFTILEGHRGKEKQNEAVKNGTSTLTFPNSKHNREPSEAVDIVPYPIKWPDDFLKKAFDESLPLEDRKSNAFLYALYLGRFYELKGVVCYIAHKHGIEIEWGGNWSKLRDFPHFQLKTKE